MKRFGCRPPRRLSAAAEPLRLLIAAIGRLRDAPEALIARDYLERATASGRAIGLGPCEIKELEARPPGDLVREGELLLAAGAPGGVRLLLDERGEAWPSRTLAARIGAWRDQGRPSLTLMIGGADGAGAAVKTAADARLAFGPQTWPHRLVRAMAAEQLYRAVTILCGSPYHRD